MKDILRKQALALIENCDTIFSVKFIKQDKTKRTMLCKQHVRKGVKGVGMRYRPQRYGYIKTFDMTKGSHRLINLNTLYALNINGHKYNVVRT